MISIVYFTYRPGGYDMLASSLGHQQFRDFETICVDDWPERDLDYIRVYLKYKGVPNVRVVRSKEKCFPQLPYGAANALNTGFCLAKGETVLVLTDFSWFPSNFLAKLHDHQERLRAGQIIVMPGRFWSKETERHETGQSCLWPYPWDGHPERNGCSQTFDWIPEGFELACTAIPMNILEGINGFPEWTDGYGTAPQEPIKEAVVKAGKSWYVDRDNFVHYVDHRNWLPHWQWHMPKRPDRPMVLPGTPNCFDLHAVRAQISLD